VTIVLINPPPVAVKRFVEKKDSVMEELYAEYQLAVREVAKAVRLLSVREDRGLRPWVALGLVIFG
jgi:hypothetical protein